MTLLEISIALTIIVAMTAAVVQITASLSAAYERGQSVEDVDEAARSGLDFMSAALASAGSGAIQPQIDPTFGADTLTYQESLGYAEGVIWGPSRTVRFEHEPGEFDDGIDNDGDGLIDEGVVVWVENEGEANELRTVVCRWLSEMLEGETPNGEDDNNNGLVDERGLSFELDGQVLTIRMSLERLGPDGHAIQKTVQTSVKVEN